MRISTLLLGLKIILLGVLHAREGTAQAITIQAQRATVQEVFKQIEKQAKVSFYYTESAIADVQPLTLDIRNKPLEEALAMLGKQANLNFKQADKVIAVTKAPKSKPKPPSTPPVISSERSDEKSRGAVQQTLTLTGVITDTLGSPIRGANIRVKDGRQAAISDMRGQFSLKDVPVGAVLLVTNLGYERLEIGIRAVNNGYTAYSLSTEQGQVVDATTGEIPYLTIRMIPAINELDQVVVQAYGETSQRLATGNITTVTAEEIERQPVMNPLQALQGKVPGMVTTLTSGYASAPIKVEIRGRNTINPNATTEPLYIVDGVPLSVLEISGTTNYNNGSPGFVQNGLRPTAVDGQSPFFSINPSDIAEITVLKDADATAIYGSRGANGVVIITTKKGKAGGTNIEIQAYQGMSRAIGEWQMLNTQQYMAMRKEALQNDGLIPNNQNAYDLLLWDTTRYTNWQNYLWGGTGNVTDAQLALAGGEGRTTFRLGTGYRKENSITAFTGGDQRASALLNLGHTDRSQKLQVSFSGLYTYTQSDMIDMIGQADIAPNSPSVFDAQGNLNYAGWEPISYLFSFANLLEPYSSKTSLLNSHIQLTYEVLKGLKFSSSFGYSTMQNNQQYLNPIVSKNPANNPVGSARFGGNVLKNWIIEPQLNYNVLVGKGRLEAMVGGTLNGISMNASMVSGQGYTNDNLLGSISNAASSVSTDYAGEYQYAAVFGRINYNWEDKYLVNLSARRDGSSRFGPGKQYGNFGAVGAAWIFSNETWMKSLSSVLSFGKLRASYGVVGSDKIGDYQYLTRWSGQSIPRYQGIVSLIPTQHANLEYQWQADKKLEAAMTLHFLKDRITVEAVRYRNLCDNQLVPISLPAMTGFPTVTANFPAAVENKGWEFLVNATFFDRKDFQWSGNFNISANKNKLVTFPGLDQSPYANQLFVGESLNLRRVLKFTGVDPETGSYTVEDKNQNGSIDYRVGNNSDFYHYEMAPRFFGGFGSDFRYKGWNLNVFFYFKNQLGRNAINGSEPAGAIGINQPLEILDRWRKPGDIAQYAKFSTQADIGNLYYNLSDALITDASFLRLQNAYLSYSIPNQWLGRIKIQGLKIYMQAQNLFVITDYQGLDPEVQNFGGMPIPKTVTLGVQLNF